MKHNMAAALPLLFTLSLVAANPVDIRRTGRRSLLETRGIGWVASQFGMKDCDSTWYHSPVDVSISRPNSWTTCFAIPVNTSKCAGSSYSCCRGSSGFVDTLRVLSAASCDSAVTAVTVDGVAWQKYSFDKDTNIFTFTNLNSAGSNQVRTVCMQLDPNQRRCNVVPELCRDTQGPSPACGVMVSDVRGRCCPVFRAKYGDVDLATPYTFKLEAVFNGLLLNCNDLLSDAELAQAALDQLARDYVSTLGLSDGDVQLGSYTCRAEDNAFSAVVHVNLRDLDPRILLRRSDGVLRNSPLGLTFKDAFAYTAPPPSPSPPPPPPPSPPPPPAPPPPPFLVNATLALSGGAAVACDVALGKPRFMRAVSSNITASFTAQLGLSKRDSLDLDTISCTNGPSVGTMQLDFLLRVELQDGSRAASVEAALRRDEVLNTVLEAVIAYLEDRIGSGPFSVTGKALLRGVIVDARPPLPSPSFAPPTSPNYPTSYPAPAYLASPPPAYVPSYPHVPVRSPPLAPQPSHAPPNPAYPGGPTYGAYGYAHAPTPPTYGAGGAQ